MPVTEITTPDGLVLKNSKDIADGFNEHFTTIGHRIVSKINNSCNIDNSPNINSSTATMYMFPVTKDEIISLVKGLKNNVAPGIDVITNNKIGRAHV